MTLDMKRNIFFILFLSLQSLAQVQAPEINMVFVKGGGLLMGCTAEQHQDCLYDEKTTHTVQLPDFYISKYDVTQKQCISFLFFVY